MKPITGTLLRHDMVMCSNDSYIGLGCETSDVIIMVCPSGLTATFRKSDGYTFERDKWQVWGMGIGGWLKIEYAPWIIVAETNDYWILKGNDGHEECFKKYSCELRPIAPPIEITCKINGKEVPLSQISEETLLNIRRAGK